MSLSSVSSRVVADLPLVTVPCLGCHKTVMCAGDDLSLWTCPANRKRLSLVVSVISLIDFLLVLNPGVFQYSDTVSAHVWDTYKRIVFVVALKSMIFRLSSILLFQILSLLLSDFHANAFFVLKSLSL